MRIYVCLVYSSKSKVEGDTSVMTYRGHIVIKTLVRCRFSPAETTGQRFIYTGCGLGRVVSKYLQHLQKKKQYYR